MATNSDSATNMSCKLFAEYFPKLSIINLYITSDQLSENNTIFIHSNQIYVPAVNVRFSLEGLSLETKGHKTPQAFRDSTFHFRLITKPLESSRGSSKAEIIATLQNDLDIGLKKFLYNSLNDIPVKEMEAYNVSCRNCNYILGSDVIFHKIRPLPGSSWEERANEMWFCHPPHPEKHCGATRTNSIDCDIEAITVNVSDVTIENSKSKIQTKANEQNIFDILQNPDLKASFYGPCYWVINPKNVPGLKQINTDGNISKAVCLNCTAETGGFKSSTCLILWDFGIEWISTVPEEPELLQKSGQDLDKKAFDNFKKVVFAGLYEWSINPTCKLTMKSIDTGNSLFLWNIDKNMSIYFATVTPTKAEVIEISIPSQKVAKFLYSVTLDEKTSVENPIDIKIISATEAIENQTIVVPDCVFKAGVLGLSKTSVLYLSDDTSLKCGYLTYEQ